MDWAKAKTILIVVFIAINILLGYRIFQANTGNIGYVDAEKIKQITEYLSEKNITIKGHIPNKKTDMTSIIVKYVIFEKEDIAGRIFSPDEKVAELRQGDTVILKGSSVDASIKDGRELNYTNNGIKPSAALDEKVCIKKINEFLGMLGLKDDANIRMVESLEGYKRFVYAQSFRGASIYNSEMEFYVNEQGVHRANIVWFESIKQAGRRAGVISPVIALLTLPQYYKDDEYSKLEVLDIQQGYYFGTGANGQVDVSEVEEGTAFPVWKITTDRDIIYVNAYNEKVEGAKKARQ